VKDFPLLPKAQLHRQYLLTTQFLCLSFGPVFAMP
jgi:hypothetical protein